MSHTVAVDMFVVATATFRLLYTVIILGTTAEGSFTSMSPRIRPKSGSARQITEASPWEMAPRYLLRDRDRSYGQVFRDRICMMGIKEVIAAARSPLQETIKSEWHSMRDDIAHIANRSGVPHEPAPLVAQIAKVFALSNVLS